MLKKERRIGKEMKNEYAYLVITTAMKATFYDNHFEELHLKSIKENAFLSKNY